MSHARQPAWSDGLDSPKSKFANSNAMRAARVVDLIAGRLGAAKPVAFVSGFWRSGTTWMQELLASSLDAKTVFEPLCSMHPARMQQLVASGVAGTDIQEAFIPGRIDADDPIWPYLDAAFHGIASSHMSVICRSSVQESFRRAIVVKDVRLQANLATVHRRYGIPVVHLRRHPCAVVSSMLSARWNWSFDHVRLATLVAPFVDDLAEDGMAAAAAAERFDGDAVSRIAAYWAFTERLAERSLRNQPWATVLAYEDAVRDPDAAIADLGRLIGRRPSLGGNPNLDSATTFGSSRGTPSKARTHAWRGRLSTADIERVHRVVETIFPAALAGLREGAA